VASSTDVRQWLREHDFEVGARGPLSPEQQLAYDQAHPPAVIPGTAEDVTVADGPDDYPPPADGPPAAEGNAGGDAPPATGERKPRAPGRGSSRGRKGKRGGFLGRLLGGRRGGGGRGRGRGGARAREPLGDWAEEMWTDLAWLASPIPPLSRMLTLQAPYAGVVFDTEVAGTPVDMILQPVAKYSGLYRALNGLVGPPLMTMWIATQGAPLRDEQNRIILNDKGEVVYDGPTTMAFQMLRYSLLQMIKVSDLRSEEVAARTEGMAERMKTVDDIVDSLFPRPKAPQPGPQAQPGPPPGPGWPAAQNGPVRLYPAPPVMDATGADPGRMPDNLGLSER
jgi:hypothetical protein